MDGDDLTNVTDMSFIAEAVKDLDARVVAARGSQKSLSQELERLNAGPYILRDRPYLTIMKELQMLQELTGQTMPAQMVDTVVRTLEGCDSRILAVNQKISMIRERLERVRIQQRITRAVNVSNQ